MDNHLESQSVYLLIKVLVHPIKVHAIYLFVLYSSKIASFVKNTKHCIILNGNPQLAERKGWIPSVKSPQIFVGLWMLTQSTFVATTKSLALESWLEICAKFVSKANLQTRFKTITYHYNEVRFQTWMSTKLSC